MARGYRGKQASRSRKKNILTAAVILAALVLAAAAVLALNRREQGREPGSRSENVSGQAGGSAVSAGAPVSGQPVQPPDASGGPDASGQQPDISGPPAVEPPPPEDPGYDFTQPAPEREAVENSYFSDAAFVGDSRTDGFMLYSGIGTGKSLTSNGLSIFTLSTKKALTIGGKKYTLLEALALEEYGKVYLSLGVNELGIYRDTKFYENYCAAIDEIRKVQPNAVIYIQGLIPLNIKQIEEYNGNKYQLNNEHLRVYNDLMRQAAEEKQVVYLDLYSEFVDENGSLPRGVSRDGVHLGKEACQQWLAYLQTHTVDFDTLYPDGPPAAAEPEVSSENGSVQG